MIKCQEIGCMQAATEELCGMNLCVDHYLLAVGCRIEEIKT